MRNTGVGVFSLFLCFIMISFSVGAQENPIHELFRKAIESFEHKDFKKSIRYFEEAITLNPKFGPAYNYLSFAYRQNGADDVAIEKILATGIKMAPAYAPLYDNLGKIFYSRSEFDKAEEFSRKAVELDPNLTSARLSLAWIYLVGKSDPESAIEHFEESVDKVNSSHAYFGLGVSYAMTGRRIEVLDMITKLRGMDRKDFAIELERMIRDNQYVPAVAKPRSRPMPVAQKSVLIADHKYNVGQEVPVRLKHSSPQLSNSASMGHQNASSSTNAADRIRQLRKRTAAPTSSSGGLGQPKGSGY